MQLRQSISIAEDYPDFDGYKKLLTDWAEKKGMRDTYFEYNEWMGKTTGICITGEVDESCDNCHNLDAHYRCMTAFPSRPDPEFGADYCHWMEKFH